MKKTLGSTGTLFVNSYFVTCLTHSIQTTFLIEHQYISNVLIIGMFSLLQVLLKTSTEKVIDCTHSIVYLTILFKKFRALHMKTFSKISLVYEQKGMISLFILDLFLLSDRFRLVRKQVLSTYNNIFLFTYLFISYQINYIISEN